jgi:hypothetical protein
MFMECPAGCSWNGWPDDVECANMVRKWVRRAESGRQLRSATAPVFAEVTVSSPPPRATPGDTETPTPIRLRWRDLVVELPADLPEPAMTPVFRAIGALR